MTATSMLGARRAELTLAVGEHGENELAVLSFAAREELSRPYSVEVTFAARPDLDVAALEGEDALLTIWQGDGPARFFGGVVHQVERLGPSRDPERWRHRVRFGPRLRLLGERRRSRVFQERTVPEIAGAILTEAGVAHRLALSAGYPKREYCVQYRESDLDFVSRLLEEEGIFYLFEHGEGEHTLVLGDSRSAYPELPGGKLIAFRDEAGMVAEAEAFTSFGSRRRTRPGAVALRDVSYLSPGLDLTARAEDEEADLEVYDHHGRYETPERGNALARVRLEEARAGAALCSGRTTSRRLCPGHVVEIGDHPDAALNGEYVVVSVSQRGDRPEGLPGGGAAAPSRYESRVVCLRAEIPFRPERRTPRPAIAGWRSAVVVGPAGEEIHTDEHGRVKVQFHWDREGRSDDRSSCWVRVAQALAGPGFGALYLPRVGHEVVVSFEEGDPDRPLVLGAAYNGANPPPLDLPGEKTRSTLRSRSSPPDSLGFNELRFEDAAGKEEVYLHAQKDLSIVVENDKTQTVGGDEKLVVEKNRNRTVNGNQSLLVKKDDSSTVRGSQSLAVTLNRTTSVGGSHAETVKGSQSVKVGGAQAVTVTLGSAETVGLGKALFVGGAYLVSVGAAMNEIVVGAKTEEVGGAKVELVGAKKTEKVAGSRSLRVSGDLTESIGRRRTVRVGKDLAVGVGGTLAQSAKESFTLRAKEVVVTAEERFAVKAGEALFALEQDGAVVLSGGKVSFTGSETLQLESPKITEN